MVKREIDISWDTRERSIYSGAIPILNINIYEDSIKYPDQHDMYNVHLKVSPIVLDNYSPEDPNTCVFEGYLTPISPITVLGCPYSSEIEVC